LTAGETELRRWDMEIKMFSPRDKLLNAMSCGIYGLLNNRLGLRKRRVLVTLTDRRLLLKETFFQKVPTLKEEYWEVSLLAASLAARVGVGLSAYMGRSLCVAVRLPSPLELP
jgi:hypothetical protein